MKTYKTVTVEKEELDNILCNMCCRQIEKNQFGYFEDYISITKKWGYGTIYDGETHCFDLCVDCYNKVISMLNIDYKPVLSIDKITEDDIIEK